MLRKYGGRWDTVYTNIATYDNNLDLLKYLCEGGCRTSLHVLRIAVTAGSVECLEYLHRKRVQVDLSIYEQNMNPYVLAACNKKRQTDIIRCLFENGYRWHGFAHIVDLLSEESANYLSAVMPDWLDI
jgi:hypothetical protein